MGSGQTFRLPVRRRVRDGRGLRHVYFPAGGSWAGIGLYCGGAVTESGGYRSSTMSKIKHGNKESKKQAVLTPKEKKAAKRARKHVGDAVPLIVPR